MVLDQIKEVNDIKQLNEEELEALRAKKFVIFWWKILQEPEDIWHRIWV